MELSRRHPHARLDAAGQPTDRNTELLGAKPADIV
jgi:hypothetical protein